LEEEKHNESSGNISYNHHKSDNFLFKVDFIEQQKVDIARFARRLYEINVRTLIFKRVNSAIGRGKEGFIDNEVACVLPTALILESIVHFFRIGRIK
jgi:hypothetical protein